MRLRRLVREAQNSLMLHKQVRVSTQVALCQPDAAKVSAPTVSDGLVQTSATLLGARSTGLAALGTAVCAVACGDVTQFVCASCAAAHSKIYECSEEQ